MADDIVNEPVVDKTNKKMGIVGYLVTVAITLIVLSFGMEGIAAIHEDRSLNFELVAKLLDALLSLVTAVTALG